MSCTQHDHYPPPFFCQANIFLLFLCCDGRRVQLWGFSNFDTLDFLFFIVRFERFEMPFAKQAWVAPWRLVKRSISEVIQVNSKFASGVRFGDEEKVAEICCNEKQQKYFLSSRSRFRRTIAYVSTHVYVFFHSCITQKTHKNRCRHYHTSKKKRVFFWFIKVHRHARRRQRQRRVLRRGPLGDHQGGGQDILG